MPALLAQELAKWIAAANRARHVPADRRQTSEPPGITGTYASLSIAAGVSLFELSRLMGTSPAMLDKTYGHMLPDALDRARSALDVFISTAAEAAEGGSR